jgi:hypothetical protein
MYVQQPTYATTLIWSYIHTETARWVVSSRWWSSMYLNLPVKKIISSQASIRQTRRGQINHNFFESRTFNSKLDTVRGPPWALCLRICSRYPTVIPFVVVDPRTRQSSGGKSQHLHKSRSIENNRKLNHHLPTLSLAYRRSLRVCT